MARKINKSAKSVEALRHEEARRRNIPTAEYQSVMQREQQDPVRVAYERRNRDLDPQLVWRGKDEQDWSDLVVHAPPLYIQEKVHPKVLVDDLLRRTEADEKAADPQPDLFADFNGLAGEEATTEFYQHDANWTNRMILGDSLQVMASLAEREGLRGKVQCIYLDPPYGIKFNSNFQWSTTSRDVKDGKADHITREPEQVKAFRDTWRDGIHSYLTYLRDRLTVARDLLADSGSIFVQIGDENVHRVRALMDEVFGEENFIGMILFKKTGGLSANYLASIGDYLLWYGKDARTTKFRSIYKEKRPGDPGATQFKYDLTEYGDLVEVGFEAAKNMPPDRVAYHDNITSQGNPSYAYTHRGQIYERGYKASPANLPRVDKAGRFIVMGKTPRYIRKLSDFGVFAINELWDDLSISGFADPKIYIVQTATSAVQRCILMTTDPGDLVLDPTCGSGTTAYVAEQWGRRWITADTSRVALALARARIMGARYPYYLLADSREGQRKEAELSGQWAVDSGQDSGQWAVDSGQETSHSLQTTSHSIRQGFVYERVPHITLKSIANNAEIDVIWERFERTLAPLREEISRALSDHKSLTTDHCLREWEVPREKPSHWPQATQPLLTEFWSARIARQKEIDASIASKADYEYLYDKPYTDNKKVRVAGPFTVESLSPHRVLGVDENDEVIDGIAESGNGYGKKQDFPTMVLENLKTTGVQQAHKEDRISFSSITPWPGRFVCAEGRFAASGQWPVISGQEQATSHNPPTTENRAAIFIGPEFGTVSRPDLVAAAREAGDAGFDALIACAFNYDARSTEFDKLGRIPVLKARMNADLHMAGDLKNTGKGNLFVIFGEPDISVVSGEWLVTSDGRMVACYDCVEKLSGLGSLEEINRLGGDDLPRLKRLSSGGEVRSDESGSSSGGLGPGERRGGGGADGHEGVSPVPERGERFAGGGRDLSDAGGEAGVSGDRGSENTPGTEHGDRPHAQRAKAIAAFEKLRPADFPLTLTTSHYTQVTVHGVDVFHPNTGEVRSDGADGIACWFIDTDYNEESFFVCQAYFLGANDPYKSLKTTLKAEINEEAWDTLNSDTSRPFDKPESGRIAVKVINHLGDEVMKVLRV